MQWKVFFHFNRRAIRSRDAHSPLYVIARFIFVCIEKVERQRECARELETISSPSEKERRQREARRAPKREEAPCNEGGVRDSRSRPEEEGRVKSGAGPGARGKQMERETSPTDRYSLFTAYMSADPVPLGSQCLTSMRRSRPNFPGFLINSFEFCLKIDREF